MCHSVEVKDSVYELAHATSRHRLIVEHVRLPCSESTVILGRDVEADPRTASVSEFHVCVHQIDPGRGQCQQLHECKITRGRARSTARSRDQRRVRTSLLAAASGCERHSARHCPMVLRSVQRPR